jgi:hypothetical protein
VLAELGGETTLAAKPNQLSRAGAGNHEPLASDRVPFQRAGVLQQEGAGATRQAAGDALDSDEARRPVLAYRLQEADDSLALDVAAEGLGDLDLGEVRPLVDLFVWLRLLGLDLDAAGRVRLARCGHGLSSRRELAVASHAKPSGSVKGPASLSMTIRCDPVPSGETPASLARARRA